jgi:hypothetical protein
LDPVILISSLPVSWLLVCQLALYVFPVIYLFIVSMSFYLPLSFYFPCLLLFVLAFPLILFCIVVDLTILLHFVFFAFIHSSRIDTFALFPFFTFGYFMVRCGVHHSKGVLMFLV